MTYTRHGHHIPGSPGETEKPKSIARCGGIANCPTCRGEAAEWLSKYDESMILPLGNGEHKPHPLMRYFAYKHLPTILATVSVSFYNLACKMDEHLPDSDQKKVALQKLLEAKDAAVRSALDMADL